jgi:outer membrane immunogenic protein
MKKLAVIAAAIAALGFVTSAYAADMPVKAYRGPMAPPVIAWNWTGFYIGINGGGGWARTVHTDTAGTTTGGFNQSGGLVGGTVGYNWQMTNWVLGIEADWDWANINGTITSPVCTLDGSTTCFMNMSSFGTGRARLGYAWDRWLVYATGGAAWAHLRAGQGSCAGPLTNCGSRDQLGWTVGGGVEVYVMPKWSIKAEYLYADFGNQAYYTPVIPVSATEKVNIVRAGLNYHF